MKLLNNPKPVVAVIILIILLFAGYKAAATELELGPTFAGEFNDGYGLTISERFVDKIDVGVTVVSEQTYKGEVIGNNGMAWLAFVAKKPEGWFAPLPDEIRIGATHWIETNRFIGCQQGYLLGLRWYLGDHATVGVLHGSNAGICKPNRGQDILAFGWRF